MGNGGEDAVLDRENRKTLRSKINITSELLTQALSESNSGLAKSLKLPRPRNTAFLKANHTKFRTVFYCQTPSKAKIISPQCIMK